MKKTPAFAPFCVICLLLAPALATADACVDCHQDAELKVQNPKLFYYFEDFRNSVHGVAELACTDCHGGDPATRDLDLAHAGVLDPVSFANIPATCGACHEEQRDTFVTSEHYRILKDDGTAPNCVTCHGGMEMDVIFVTRVKSTCAFCHNLESDILPDVPDRADYVLNKINIMKSYRGFVDTHARDRVQVKALDELYLELVARWHRFDLDNAETEANALLGEYRQAKSQAMKDRRNK